VVSGGTGSEEADTGELGAVAVGVPVAPAMPVAAVVGPVCVPVDPPAAELVADDEEDEEVDEEEEPPLVVGAALPLVPIVPTGLPGTDVSEEDVDSGAEPEPLIRKPVKSSPFTETSTSGSVPPLRIAPLSSASPPWV
jgi:hypothetical protein